MELFEDYSSAMKQVTSQFYQQEWSNPRTTGPASGPYFPVSNLMPGTRGTAQPWITGTPGACKELMSQLHQRIIAEVARGASDEEIAKTYAEHFKFILQAAKNEEQGRLF